MSKLPLLAILMAPFLLGHEGCEYSGQWKRHIKKVDIICNWTSVTVNVHHDGMKFDCALTDGDNGGEIPYLLLYIDGCSAHRVNGLDGQTFVWTDTLKCTGDSIQDIAFRACQTHGGPLPDDCTDKAWYEVTP